jgi:hypothetical protein
VLVPRATTGSVGLALRHTRMHRTHDHGWLGAGVRWLAGGRLAAFGVGEARGAGAEGRRGPPLYGASGHGPSKPLVRSVSAPARRIGTEQGHVLAVAIAAVGRRPLFILAGGEPATGGCPSPLAGSESGPRSA